MDYDIAPIEASEDEALVRWVAMLLIEGKSESEIRRSLVQNHLIESALSLDGWKSLLLASTSEAKELRSMVVNRAELGSTDWLRLDSYTMNRMERMIDLSEAQADSISKMSSVAFMANGLVKAQESMDKFTGAQEAVPQVQVNISYDPLDQFRGVIQAESKSAIISNTDWSIITDEEE